MPDETTPPEPTQEPTVRELLVAEVDATCRRITLELDRLNRITDQLAPDRSRSCQIAVALTRVAVDEIRLRAAARPLASPNRERRSTGAG
jgi:hypothetical protein